MTLRSRILILVVFLAVVPLVLMGLWTTGTAARSGEALLRSRLDRALAATAEEVGTAWSRHRAALLDLAESPHLRTVVSDAAAPESLASFAAWANLGDTNVLVETLDGEPLWPRDPQRDASSASAPTLPLRVDVHASPLGPPTGRIEASLPVRDLFADVATATGTLGAVIAARDPDTGDFLLPTPFDPGLLARERFRWGGEDWLTVSRSIAEPSLLLLAAAPLTPYTEPFRAAARRSAWLLGLVALIGLAGTAFLTARMTGSLERVARAAGAIADGRLEARLPEGSDEIGRVARAFNRMTDSLRRTLDELSERRSLALVGEFAASLAHEVRNPLSSIRVDLQLVEESLPPGSPEHELQAGALREIQRLDATVTGALHAARSGRPASGVVDLRESLDAAVRTATAEAARARIELRHRDWPESLPVRGDPNALQQLFLNLLLNAIQASSPDSSVEVSLQPLTADGIRIDVTDHGAGMTQHILDHAFDPLFSTRPDGTGLGLPIARRIAEAHGGSLALLSRPEAGTTARLELPLSRPPGASERGAGV